MENKPSIPHLRARPGVSTRRFGGTGGVEKRGISPAASMIAASRLARARAKRLGPASPFSNENSPAINIDQNNDALGVITTVATDISNITNRIELYTPVPIIVNDVPFL